MPRLPSVIDWKAARGDPGSWRAALARKGVAEEFDALLEADRELRQLKATVEPLRASTKLKGKPTPEQLEELKSVKAELQRLEADLEGAETRFQQLLGVIPNPPDSSAPDGFTDEDAVELKRVGEPRQFSFEPRDHLELGEIDMERGAKVSGSRFAYRLGDAALTELALYRFALDRLVAKGFTPVLPPVLVREEAMYGTGFLPTDEVNLYRIERDDLYLTGTSEVTLAAFHMGEELEVGSPLRYAGYSTCFRREAGAAGKDTRGMFRVHQFDKVEMFVFCLPERSTEEHEYLLSVEEELVAELGIPYRVVNIAAGDLGASAAKKYDIEAWFPSQERYREITSTSNTTDYQARRLGVRFRADGNLQPVHTLNGTAVTARLLLAIMENFQEESGSYAVPQVLEQFGAPRKARADS
jgi:seryl-tRNA synthetase